MLRVSDFATYASIIVLTLTVSLLTLLVGQQSEAAIFLAISLFLTYGGVTTVLFHKYRKRTMKPDVMRELSALRSIMSSTKVWGDYSKGRREYGKTYLFAPRFGPSLTVMESEATMPIDIDEAPKELLTKSGFEVKKRIMAVGETGVPYEVDIVAQKGGQTILIETKNRTVISPDVCAFYEKTSDLQKISLQVTPVIVSRGYSSKAEEIAREKGVKIFDIDTLRTFETFPVGN